MKLLGIAFSGAALVALAAPSAAADNWSAGSWYVGLGAAYSSMTDVGLPDSATVLVGGSSYTFDKAKFSAEARYIATAGYAFDNHLRAELEVGFTNPSIESVTVNGDDVKVSGIHYLQWTFMANALYDIPLTEKLSASVGGGIGMARTSLKVGTVSDRSNTFAYQAIAGLSYSLTKHVDVQLDYRYLTVSGLDYFGPDEEIDAASHNFMFSLRYRI